MGFFSSSLVGHQDWQPRSGDGFIAWKWFGVMHLPKYGCVHFMNGYVLGQHDRSDILMDADNVS